ncbi:MAG: WG repeat-containing protein [Bacteroidales bacterium]|nr:WG repeat-containing protein [Bacteroidales bacterium]
MKKSFLLFTFLLLSVFGFSQYPQIRSTDSTKVITVSKLLDNLTVSDGVFFLGKKLFDVNGNLLFDGKEFDDISDFYKGKATFSKYDKVGIIDKNGKVLWSASKKVVPYLSRGLENGYLVRIVKKQNGVYREFVNDKGVVIFPNLTRKTYYDSYYSPHAVYELNSYPFVDGLARFHDKQKNRWGYINKKGVIVIPAKFKYAHDFSDSLAAVVDENTGNWGFINQKGIFVIEPKFSKVVEDFISGITIVEKKDGLPMDRGEKVLMNKAGEFFSYGWYGKIFRTKNLLFLQKEEEYYKYKGRVVNKDGKILFEGEASDLFPHPDKRGFCPISVKDGNILTEYNLRDSTLNVIFVSKSSVPVDGEKDYWYKLSDAGDGYVLVREPNYGAVIGIANSKGELIIKFEKSEF